MKTTISFEFDGKLSNKEKAYLGNLLADALEAFQASRGPTAEEYLLKRIRENPAMPMSEDNLKYKIEEIETRVGLAGKLREAARDASIKEVA